MRDDSEKYLTPDRLEAFSDGVIAIIITIMVLELKVPHTTTLQGFLEIWPIFMSYGLSYLIVAIYWVNHHYLFHCIEEVSHKVLWANNMLLFFLSLIPFTTAYVGENHMSAFPTALYSGLLLICGFSFFVLRLTIASHLKEDDEFMAINNAAKKKNMFSMSLYLIAVFAAYLNPMISFALIGFVSIIYFIPTTMIKKKG